LELAINRAVLSIHQQQFEKARYWLNVEKDLLKKGHIEEGKYCCQLVRILYYEAQVLLKTGDFAEAKLVYQEALKQAGFIQWQQMEVYILNWLAEVAIAQNDPNEAERLLKISLPIAERKNDRRSIALHQRSFAKLERLKGNITQFQKWAAEASEAFERLGMLLDAHIYSNTGDNWLD
jgi:LuxR family glucitol operon transcriptional activator